MGEEEGMEGVKREADMWRERPELSRPQVLKYGQIKHKSESYRYKRNRGS